jgi:hypothetical protein
MSEELRGRFNKFLEYVVESLDISETHYKDAETRYQALCRWLSRSESAVAIFELDMYPQGSFRLGTVIKPLTDKEEYDIDLVCEISLTKDKVSQKKLKELVGNEIKSYATANNMNFSPEDCRRCWKLIYADGAQFHLDILPAIPDGDSFRMLLKSKGFTNKWSELAIAITDKTLPNYNRLDDDWPHSNPKGYSEWFKKCMERQFEIQLKSMAKILEANVEDVPEYEVKTPLQHAIQILKRHRDIMFAEDQEDKPISIIITTLAAHAYNNEADILDTLINIVPGMANYIEIRDGISWIPNPVDPLENFADKWEEYPRREQNFRRWLQQIQADLNTALKASSIQAISEILKPRLGERTVNKALKHFPQINGNKSSTFITGVSYSSNHFYCAPPATT